MTLLAGLGEAWSAVIMTLDGTQATWKKEQVVARLINEEARRTKLHGDAIGTAHFSRNAKAKGAGHFKRRNDGINRGSSNGSAPSRTALPSRAAPLSRTALHCPTTSAATAATTVTAATSAPTAAMASPTVLTFDAEGRAVDFDVWVDDLQLFLRCDSKDGVSLFDHTSGVSTAPAATADSTIRSQWTTRDAFACLAVCSHLPPAERAHLGQYKTALSLYDAVVARYSSPATAALSRLMLPYHFPDLAAFATVTDLVAHLRTSDARYRAALPTEDHFLSLCPTELTVDLLEEFLAAAEKRILAVGAPRGDRRTPFFKGRSELRLPLVGDAATPRARGARVVGGVAGEAVEEVEEAEGVAVEVGVVPGMVASVEAAAGVVEAAAAVVEVAAAMVPVEVQPRSVEALVVASASSSRAPVRSCRPSSFSTWGGVWAATHYAALLRGANLQDAWVDQFALGGQRVTHCTCSRMGHHLATFTHRPGSSLYTLTTAPPPVCPPIEVSG
ncbi:unnamed protein product [Closterium sp. NIES-53]